MNGSGIVIIEDKCLDYMLSKEFWIEDYVSNSEIIPNADKNHRRLQDSDVTRPFRW
jgi:hypothetical protein